MKQAEIDLKCSDDYGVNAVEMSKESLMSNESPSITDFKCSWDVGKAEESLCSIDSKGLHECVVDTIKDIEVAQESSRIDIKGSLECVVDAITNVELAEESPSKADLKGSGECVVDAVTDVEMPQKSPSRTDLKGSTECTINAVTYVEMAKESSSTTGLVESRECTVNATTDAELAKASPSRIELVGSCECVVNATTDVEMAQESPSRTDLKHPRECIVDSIMDVDMAEESSSRSAKKRSHECVVDASEQEAISNKMVAKEILNDDAMSEVLNPNVSPRDNASSSQTSMINLCEEVANNGEHYIYDFSNSYSTKAEMILEAPKSTTTCGIRRIKFKFSKSKNPNNGVSESDSRTEFVDSIENTPASTSRMASSESEFHRHSTRKEEMEFKTSKKDDLSSFPTNVKKLFATGILEGVHVKYIKLEKELLCGTIKDSGYLCGCSLCKYSRVLTAYQFELHAGCSTKHPNNHIYLENGKPIYSIIQVLKTTPHGLLEEAVRSIAGSLISDKSYMVLKESLRRKNIGKNGGTVREDTQSQEDLSFPSCFAQATEGGVCPLSNSLVQKFSIKEKSSWMQNASNAKKQLARRSTTSNRLCRPASNASISYLYQKNNTGGRKKRDNDLHKFLFMPNGLPDGAKLAYYSKGQRILEGYKQGSGIVCNCCDNEISPSQFEAHAGCAAKRQPYRHIFTSYGVTLHDVALSLANAQSLSTSESDDMCTECGGGGDLVKCEGCCKAFHTDCLNLQCIPESDLYCPYCKDKTALSGEASFNESYDDVRPNTIRLTRVVKAPAPEIGGCVVCRAHDFSLSRFDERTVILCDQELPDGKWFCCGDCSRIHATLLESVASGAKAIPASLSSIINRSLIEHDLADQIEDDVQWQLLSGKFVEPDNLCLLSKAAAIFRVSFP
ncbi:hypothetical protein GIB67_015060 [Kingdonia uniflora]|uniref:PHD-type domain-containing protein n=1 Tax=Kingdonia uniflora TaxID=39325 RepID=A0A7J7NN46_9MAGN|nr:hypothetical protein GIB67_015060 [Kingdonia uniflora]